MLTLVEAIRAAGLIPVDAGVHLENYLYDVLTRDAQGKVSIAEPLAQQVMRPWEISNENFTKPVPVASPKVTLIYFWMPGCENCTEGMNELQQLSQTPRFPPNLQISFMAYNVDITQSVADDMAAAHLAGPVYVDTNGAIAERLAVLGSPALVLVDEQGTVVARFNGEVEFDSPGFDLLLSKIGSAAQPSLKHPEKTRETLNMPLAYTIRTEVKVPRSPTVTFLSVPLFGIFLIGAFIIICYGIGKSVMRHRKISLKVQK